MNEKGSKNVHDNNVTKLLSSKSSNTAKKQKKTKATKDPQMNKDINHGTDLEPPARKSVAKKKQGE